MSVKKVLTYCVALSVVTCLGAFASQDKARALIDKLSASHAKVSKEFNAIGNLKGFVISPKEADAHDVIMYSDKSGRYAFIGTLINAKEQNVTQTDFVKYIQPKLLAKQSQQAEKALASAKDTNWFAQGSKNAKHIAYAIVEPNCSICHLLYTELEPYIKSGDLQMRWILVHFLNSNSKAKAAAILSSKDPAVAMALNEKRFNMSDEEGGIAPLTTVPSKLSEKLDANNKFMQKFGYNGTPVLLYYNKEGKAVALNGLPRQKNGLSTLLASISGKLIH